MAVTNDILRTWRAPRAVIRDHLALGPREDRALIYLMVSCAVICIAQWPRLAREAHLTGAPLDQLIGSAVYAWLFLVPLVLYGLAAVVTLALRGLGSRAGGTAVRLSLFWGLLAATPAALLYGLMTGLAGPGPGTSLVGAIWLAALAIFWVQGLREAAT